MCIFGHRKGKFYTIEVYAKNGRPHSPKVLKAQLERIVELAGGETSLRAYHDVPICPANYPSVVGEYILCILT